MLVAATPQAFSASILPAYDDEQLWLQLPDAALANLERNFSFLIVIHQLQKVMKQGKNNNPLAESGDFSTDSKSVLECI